ncbi:MAG: AMP-binding protein [Scytonematopsis contorta HA4267-MV1]|jgi:amino acid adenylation domain-containing protein|nr:AMP-binding protein [Scytonematopsis contorta HA4267-MV1]
MSYLFKANSEQLLQQKSISMGSVNPANSFIQFKEEDTEQSITKRFEQQVSKYPHTIAIKTKIKTLTYDQLNKTANRLARTIISKRGEGQELVGLLLEQGTDFVTSIIGVLKTGKFYVPMDSSVPANRLTSIVEDSGTTLIVTNNRNILLAREIASTNCLILNLDDIDTTLSCDNLELSISPDSPAFVIYTSGSTGKPKGVLQNHRNILHNCMNNTNALCISPEDRLTLLHSCGVMGAMRGICNALLNGASLYPLNIKEEGLPSLSKLLKEEGITIYHSVATLFRHFVASLNAGEEFPKLRVLILGGEQVLQRDIELYKQHFSSNCIVFVSLGSTETGTVRQFIVNKQTKIHTSTVPIGYPVEGMEVLLLDDTGAEVKRGDIGEITVRSKYLALAYWQNPELTNSKFSIDPNDVNKRIYYTGDLGSFDPDGCLIHMGRKDFQVKIRGFRIEISEIEIALMNTGVVKEVVVVACEDVRKEKRLVAYVVPSQNPTPTPKELRFMLQDKIPDYMLPSTFVYLNALPLTPNSKIDRLALPAPDFVELDSSDKFIAPRNDIELQIVKIWEEVLGISPIGVRDSFFDMGGHSLLAVQIFAQIEKKLGHKLPLATLFPAGTIETIADIIIEVENTSNIVNNISAKLSWSSLVGIQPHGSKPPMFFIHPLGGEVMCYRNLSVYLEADQPVYGLQPVGLDGEQLPYTKVEDMASHYIREMQTVQPHGPYFIGGYSFGGIVAFEIAQQLYRLGEKVAFLAMVDTCRPGYSTRLPLLKRIPIHVKKLIQEPTQYIHHKFIGIGEWSNFHLKEKYKHYSKIANHFLDIASTLSEGDEHLNIMQANATAMSEYYFQEAYPGRLTLFRTADEERDEDKVGVVYDPEFGWKDLFTEGVDVHHIFGAHDKLLDQPYVEIIGKKFKVCLENAYRRSLLMTSMI